MKKIRLLSTILISSLLLTGCNKTVIENHEIIDDCVTVDWEDSCISDINEPVVDKPISCNRYFDGCNRCTLQNNWAFMCTEQECEEYKEAYCADEQYNQFLEDIKSSWEQPQ